MMTRCLILLAAGAFCATAALAGDPVPPASPAPSVMVVQPAMPPGPPPPAPPPEPVPRSVAIASTRNCVSFYPRQSLHAHEYGQVTLTYDVDAAGHAQNVKVSGSSGFPRLDEAAIACAVTQWRDTPAQFNGQPIPSPGHAAKVSFFMR